MPRRSIWKGSFVDAFPLRMQKKRDLLLIWARSYSPGPDDSDPQGAFFEDWVLNPLDEGLGSSENVWGAPPPPRSPSPPCNSDELFEAFIAQGRGASSSKAAEAPEPAEVPHADPNPNWDPESQSLEKRIGGETSSQIYSRLVSSYRGKTLPSPDILCEKASSIFAIKGKILHKMEDLDPGGGWLSGGARFLKTRKGAEFSLKTLHSVFDCLESQGADSPHYRAFIQHKGRGDL